MSREPYITRAQILAYQRFAIDVRERNEQNVRRWRRERRVIRDSNLRTLTVVVRP
jgi:hypothetical protein